MADGFTFDPVALRYRAPNGRYVSEAGIRQAVDAVVQASTQRVAGLTERLVAGTLDLPTWQQGMAAELKAAHLATAAAGQGGWAQMAPAAYGRVGAALRTQYDYLAIFALDLATGRQPLDGRAVNRARLYGEAARGTYEQTRRVLMAQRPHMEERRLLHASESCPPCRNAANHWEPIGTLPRIGTLQCRGRCKCTWEFRPAPQEVA